VQGGDWPFLPKDELHGRGGIQQLDGPFKKFRESSFFPTSIAPWMVLVTFGGRFATFCGGRHPTSSHSLGPHYFNDNAIPAAARARSAIDLWAARKSLTSHGCSQPAINSQPLGSRQYVEKT
jgi:hypothetical protein